MDRRVLLAALAAMTAGRAMADPVTDFIGRSTGAGLPPGVTGRDAESGLRQALSKGAVAAVLRVGRLDGFWADNHIRIPLPGPLGSLQKTLSPLGMGGPLDDLQLKINRAAETAAPKAKKLFVDAITGMTVDDVVGVLRGGDTAGTQYLRNRTGGQLGELFRPPMRQALDSTGAMRSLKRVVADNNVGGLFGGDPAASLTGFAVGKALDGVFYYVGEEERAIRQDPVKQSTSLLRKVFGNL